jgi:lipopolysaccharide transport system ATP-binding protein
MATAIKVENLSKIYRLGEIGTGTISRDLERFFKMKILKQEDPFLRIGEANDRATKGASDIVYSLKDINFEIEQGDAVGIIGRNGAGKSTLLKILSKVTSPTTGKINIKGRVASLLEVGTGFHPELTGRENIYLNGAILGMRKKEIDRKFDEIVDFSGVERYIDTPVKRYSSGMYVRLAFAVAAHLESEILIVDEVLAVGDAEFQKKCLGKMGEVSKAEGRTVLFVSHNLAAVKQLCNKGLCLSNGLLIDNDTSDIVAKNYIKSGLFSSSFKFINYEAKSTDILLAEVLLNEDAVLSIEQDFELSIKYQLEKNLIGSIINFIISNEEQIIWQSFDTDCDNHLLDLRESGVYQTKIIVPAYSIKPGKFNISIGIGIANSSIICQHDKALSIELISNSNKYVFISYREDRVGVVPSYIKWETIKI